MRSGLAAAFREDLPLLLIVGLFAVTAFISNLLSGYPVSVDWGASRRLFIFATFYAVLATFAVMIHMVVVRKRSLRRLDTWRSLLKTVYGPQETLNFLLVASALTILMPVFLAYKQSIPAINAFSWDPAFAEWDRVLHLGRHPYEWLQPVLAHPTATKILDILYFSWIHVMWLTIIWQAWHGSRTSKHRSQFLLAFGLSWIVIGTVLATLLSSAGPVYYDRVTGLESPYGSLMAYLQMADAQVGVRALTIQEYLWTAYVNPQATMLAGISAMPSMHIAIVALLVPLGFSVNRWLGWLYTFFAFAIFVGSIHLAWHYAIDGYVSILLMAGLWWICGKVVESWQEQVSTL